MDHNTVLRISEWKPNRNELRNTNFFKARRETKVLMSLSFIGI